MGSLADILAKKKAKREANDLLPKPSVELFLNLYDLDPKFLYINYMEDFRWLVWWLGLPTKTTETGSIPALLNSYTLQEIAKHLEVDPYSVYLVALRKAKMQENIS